MSNVPSTIRAMIEAIPDGNANMRGRVSFLVMRDEVAELTPWLALWNQTKEGKFNGRWEFHLAEDHYYRLHFKATGM